MFDIENSLKFGPKVEFLEEYNAGFAAKIHGRIRTDVEFFIDKKDADSNAKTNRWLEGFDDADNGQKNK